MSQEVNGCDWLKLMVGGVWSSCFFIWQRSVYWWITGKYVWDRVCVWERDVCVCESLEWLPDWTVSVWLCEYEYVRENWGVCIAPCLNSKWVCESEWVREWEMGSLYCVLLEQKVCVCVWMSERDGGVCMRWPVSVSSCRRRRRPSEQNWRKF